MNPAFARRSKTLFLSLLILLFLPALSRSEEGPLFLEGDGVRVQYTESQRRAAEEIIKLFPTVRAELEKTLGWPLDNETTVVLSEGHESFQRRAENDLVVAYAVPLKNLIVLDSSKMNQSPFNIGANLKHELCHLFLHRHIPEDRLPKWFDEGIAQWVSGGVAEILMGGSDRVLDQASLSRKLIPIADLAQTFPRDDRSFRLAYEESKSLVEFIVNTAGADGLRNILADLRDGAALDDAVSRQLGYSLGELERNWRQSLKGRMTWWAYMSRHLYSILFFLAGLATFFGFVRLLIRKRAYVDEDDEEDWKR